MTRDTGPGALDGGRHWRRTAVIAAPWALAAVLALLGILAARDAPASPTPAPTTPAPATAPPATTAPDAADRGTEQAAVGATDGARTPLPAEVELAVLSTARPVLGQVGLTGSPAGPDRWTLEARIAAVEVVTAEYAVATVHGLVIELRDGDWHGPRPRAAAVLLRTTPSTAVVGTAWPLPAPALPTVEVDLRDVDDPDPSIVATLQDAGWTVEEVTSAETSEDALLRVRLHGTAPGGATPTDHVLWLLDAPGGPRLLPQTAPTTTEDLP